jgi:hypothetical protein
MISAYVYQDSTLTNNLPIILYSLFRERSLSLALYAPAGLQLAVASDVATVRCYDGGSGCTGRWWGQLIF